MVHCGAGDFANPRTPSSWPPSCWDEMVHPAPTPLAPLQIITYHITAKYYTTKVSCSSKHWRGSSVARGRGWRCCHIAAQAAKAASGGPSAEARAVGL